MQKKKKKKVTQQSYYDWFSGVGEGFSPMRGMREACVGQAPPGFPSTGVGSDGGAVEVAQGAEEAGPCHAQLPTTWVGEWAKALMALGCVYV